MKHFNSHYFEIILSSIIKIIQFNFSLSCAIEILDYGLPNITSKYKNYADSLFCVVHCYCIVNAILHIAIFFSKYIVLYELN